MDLRCDNRILHGILDFDDRVIEVKCRSSRCGARAGVVVIHRFSTDSGNLLETLKFKDPAKRKEKDYAAG